MNVNTRGMDIINAGPMIAETSFSAAIFFAALTCAMYAGSGGKAFGESWVICGAQLWMQVLTCRIVRAVQWLMDVVAGWKDEKSNASMR